MSLPKILQQLRDHIAAFFVHGATSAATAGRLMIRGADGRVKAAPPSDNDDVALKQTVLDGDAAISAALGTDITSLQQQVTAVATALNIFKGDNTGAAAAAPAAESGVGQFVTLTRKLSAPGRDSIILPSGGMWAYCVFYITQTGGTGGDGDYPVRLLNVKAGVDTGGTTIATSMTSLGSDGVTTISLQGHGFAWRVS
jgi:hypothetical protein